MDCVVTTKIDWDKIIDAHPFVREIVAENEGVTVQTTKKVKQEDKTLDMFEEKNA